VPISTKAVPFANWLNVLPQNGATSSSPVPPSAVERFVNRHGGKLGPAGVAAVRTLYNEASVNGPPTYASLRTLVETTQRQLRNERAPGRTNDGLVDAREVAQLKSPSATAVFAFLESVKPASVDVSEGATASTKQLKTALTTLDKTVDAAFKALPRGTEPTYSQVVSALKKAGAGLPKDALDTLILATNGVTGRGAGGSVTEGRVSVPTAGDVKKALQRAQAALLSADGAVIADVKNPTRAGWSKRDGAVTELEVNRSPAVRGQAARALLRYASGLE
jgi:hypothetical protein